MNNIVCSWEEFKQVLEDTQLMLKWIKVGDKYYISVLPSVFVVSCEINISDPPNDDQIDFEENYQNI